MTSMVSVAELHTVASGDQGVVIDVRNVEGGMSAWRAQGHALETGMTSNLQT